MSVPRSNLGGRPAAARASAIAALVLASACAGASVGPKVDFVWPVAPDKPRLRYVRTIARSSEIETGLWATIVRAVGGGSADHDVFNPTAVALSVDETILYIVCGNAQRVLAYDLARHSTRRIADDQGVRPLAPFGIAVDGDDRIYITDQKDPVVWVYSRDGKFLSRIGAGKLVRPTGVAIDAKRRLVYVVDSGSYQNPRHVIEVFAPDGRHVRTVGSRGTDPGQFLYPTYAAVSPDGNLYVSDTLNARVQEYDPEGTPLASLGTLGDALGEFGKPKGIAFDSMGNIHIADSELARVQVFDPRHRLLMHYGEKGFHPALMLLPSALAIGKNNHIYIADYAANHVNEYVLFDTSPAEPAKPAGPAAASPAAASPGPASPVPAPPAAH